MSTKHLKEFIDDYATCTSDFVTIDYKALAKDALEKMDKLFHKNDENNICEVEWYVLYMVTLGWSNFLDPGESLFADALYSTIKNEKVVEYFLKSYIKDTKNKTCKKNATLLLHSFIFDKRSVSKKLGHLLFQEF